MATRWFDPDDQDLLSLWWLEETGELQRAELAAALGLSDRHAAVRVQRMKKQLDVSRLVVQALEATPRCAGLADITANGTEHRVRCGASGSRGVCVTARPARGRAGACSHRPSAGRPATARVDPAWVGATVAGQAWPAATAPAGTAPTAPVAAGRRDGTARGQQHRTGGASPPTPPPTVRGVGHSLWTGGAVAAVAACALVASYLTTDHSAPVARTAPPSPCGGAPAPSSPRQHDPPPSPHPRSGPRRPPPGPGPTPPPPRPHQRLPPGRAPACGTSTAPVRPWRHPVRAGTTPGPPGTPRSPRHPLRASCRWPGGRLRAGPGSGERALPARLKRARHGWAVEHDGRTGPGSLAAADGSGQGARQSRSRHRRRRRGRLTGPLHVGCRCPGVQGGLHHPALLRG